MAARRPPRHAGFLLAETLATFTISAFVLLGLVSASSVLLQAIDRSVAHVQDVDDLGRTMAAITRDVGGLRRARWYGLEPQPYVFRGGPNSLFFAHREIGQGGIGETKVIAIREIVGGMGTRLVRSDAKLPPQASDFEAIDFGPQRDLPTGPARLRFFYVMGAGKGKSEQSRVTSWPVGPTLPVAVIVEAVEAVSKRLIVGTRIPIRANADIGCLGGSQNEGFGLLNAGAPPPGPGQFPAQGSPGPGVPGQAFPGQIFPGQGQAAQPIGAPPLEKASTFCGRADKDDTTDSAAVIPGSGEPRIGEPRVGIVSPIQKSRGPRDGYILVAVLGIMVLLTGFLAAGSVLVRSALQAARVGDEEAAMGGLTDGGFELTAYQLFVLKRPPPFVSGRRIKFGGGTIAPTITNEGGKVDLNGSRPALLQSEFEATGLDEAAARAVVARIIALRGPDPSAAPPQDNAQQAGLPGTISPQPPGASPPGAGAAARPRGFQSVDDLRAFPEVNQAAYRRLAPHFTVFNPDGRIDISTAATSVLMAIPGMDKSTVDRVVAGRIGATKAVLENLAASLGTAQDYTKVAGGPAYTVRIDAIAADGRKKSVAAVMAAAKSPNVPYYILEWQD